jgi:hypothetical protein
MVVRHHWVVRVMLEVVLIMRELEVVQVVELQPQMP